MSDPPLTPTRVERIRELFDAASALPAEQRAAFLDENVADAELRADVVALLVAHESGDDRLDRPVSPGVLDAFDPTSSRDDDARWTGVRLGPWLVGRRIGAGGMGAVYEAVRADDEYHQRVAIKLLRRGVEGEAAVRRFRVERQILARLNHANIATLLDAGTSTDGQPYLVMEFVDGVPITQWCDEQRLGVRERVALFGQVCAAVQHAHQNLVVHRDLKPGNILVTTDGVVKLLDFGIAKLMPGADDVADRTATHVGQRAFTPEYAAPELFREQGVGTSADVYALGVVLFELLTGRRPIQLDGRSWLAIEAAVCSTLPPRPSTVLGAERSHSLRERSLDRARDRIAGDLDAIIMMALRKEPERRYGSVEQLGRDLLHYLNGLPVTARPDGFGYRARKLIRRRRMEVAAGAVAVLSLLGGSVGATVQARRAQAESDRATQVVEFLDEMLTSADPAAYGRDVTVRDMLDTAAVHAASLAGRPAIEAEIRSIIGNTYITLGEYDLAETQFRLGLAANRRAAPRGDRSTGIALTRLAKAFEYQGRMEAADSLFTEAWALLRRFPPEPMSRAVVLDNHGRVLYLLGRNGEAARAFEESLNLAKIHGPGLDSSLATTYNNLSVVQGTAGNYVAADTLMQHALVHARRAHGEDHALVVAITAVHASLLSLKGDNERADTLYRMAIEKRRRLLGPQHPELIGTLSNYADHLNRMARYPEAAQLAREILGMGEEGVEETSHRRGSAMQTLGRALSYMDSLEAGERWLRASLEHRRANLPVGHWLVTASESSLGEHMVLARRFAEAETLLLAAEQRLVELRGENAPVVRDTRQRLVMLYEAWQRPADAEHWRVRLAQ
jgi:eukaryotic-like serine/threonine-protein kinase